MPLGCAADRFPAAGGQTGRMRRIGFRRRHPAPILLSRYLDDDLDRNERRSLEDHLLRCARCRRLLESLAYTIRSIAALPPLEAPGLAEGIIAELRAADAPASDPERRPRGATGSVRRLRPAPGRAAAAARQWLTAPRLRLTIPLALLVGVILSLVNQGGMILSGKIDLEMCAICGLNFVLPFLALNLALVAAARVKLRRR
jgi:putative zinc finger protein